MKIEKAGYTLIVNPDGFDQHSIVVSVGNVETGHAILLNAEEARTLHTDLGEMIGRFVLDDA